MLKKYGFSPTLRCKSCSYIIVCIQELAKGEPRPAIARPLGARGSSERADLNDFQQVANPLDAIGSFGDPFSFFLGPL